MAAFADLTKAIWNPTEPDDQDLAVLGTFDNTISGWAECLEAIYNDIGGCFFIFFLIFLSYLSYVLFVVRPPSPPFEACGLLQAAAVQLGAAMRGVY